MSKRAFGQHYYSMEDSYHTKAEAEKNASKIKKEGKFFVRIAKTNWPKGSHQWAIYIRHKK